MESSRQHTLARALAVLGVLIVLASVLYAVCYSNIIVYYSDGTSQSCATFCTFQGGWLCR